MGKAPDARRNICYHWENTTFSGPPATTDHFPLTPNRVLSPTCSPSARPRCSTPPLIQTTIGAIGWTLTGTDNDDDAAAIVGQFFRQRGNRLSFTNTLIAEHTDRPVGLAVLYPGELARDLDLPLREHRRLLGLDPEITAEGQPGELYLDTLALIPSARGQGWGGQLLDACAAKADALGLPLALLVEDDNPAARLYTRHGFVPVEHVEVAGHGYTRLRRAVSGSVGSGEW